MSWQVRKWVLLLPLLAIQSYLGWGGLMLMGKYVGFSGDDAPGIWFFGWMFVGVLIDFFVGLTSIYCIGVKKYQSEIERNILWITFIVSLIPPVLLVAGLISSFVRR